MPVLSKGGHIITHDWSSNYGVIENKEITYITIDATAGFEAGIRLDFTGTVYVDWNDGNAINTFTTGAEKLHTFVDAGIYIVKIWGDLKNITLFAADNCRITNIQNLKTGTSSISLFSNLLTGELDLSGVRLYSLCYVYSNSNLTGLKFSNYNDIVAYFNCSNCNITGILDFTNVPLGSIGTGTFTVANNPNLINVVFKSTGNSLILSPNFSNCNLTGTLNLSNISLKGSKYFFNNPNLTDIIFSDYNEVGSLSLYNTGLSGILDLSNVPVSGTIMIHDLLSITNIIFASSGNSTVNYLRVDGCDLTGVLDLSSIPINMSSAQYIYFYNNTNLTSIIFSSSGNGLLFRMYAYSCNLGYINFNTGGFILEANSTSLRIENNNMTAAEVNQILYDLDVMSTSGYTGRSINIGGTNADPDSSSGGYDGLAAKASLEGKGFTVTIT